MVSQDWLAIGVRGRRRICPRNSAPRVTLDTCRSCFNSTGCRLCPTRCPSVSFPSYPSDPTKPYGYPTLSLFPHTPLTLKIIANTPVFEFCHFPNSSCGAFFGPCKFRIHVRLELEVVSISLLSFDSFHALALWIGPYLIDLKQFVFGFRRRIYMRTNSHIS